MPRLFEISGDDGCSFPTSAGRPWTFCGCVRRPSSVYCQTHYDLCKVKIPGRREADPLADAVAA